MKFLTNSILYWIVVVVWSLSHVRFFCDPVDCSLPGSPVHGISQARILEWVAISFSRGSSQDSMCDKPWWCQWWYMGHLLLFSPSWKMVPSTWLPSGRKGSWDLAVISVYCSFYLLMGQCVSQQFTKHSSLHPQLWERVTIIGREWKETQR